MSVITKIILDTSEYKRLLSIEKAYHELKERLHEGQSGSGKTNCTCSPQKEHCSSTPPLSEIIAKNELSRSVDPPPKGILPSITDPNDANPNGQGQSKMEKNPENFDAANFRVLADDKTKWYFLGHYEEK